MLREDKASGEAHVTGVDRRHPLYRAHRRWPEAETAGAAAASEAAANDASGAICRPPDAVLGHRLVVPAESVVEVACWLMQSRWHIRGLSAAPTHRRCFISVAHSSLRSAVSMQGCASRSCSGRT